MTEIVVPSPLGQLWLRSDGHALTGLAFTRGGGAERQADPVLRKAVAWLGDYFARRFRAVDFAVDAQGSDHQRRVWAAMREIPLGSVATYGDIAREIGSAPRAVGVACGANPIAIIIPCHRVVGAGGSLGGYSGLGGLATKRKLLEIEAAKLRAGAQLFDSLTPARTHAP